MNIINCIALFIFGITIGMLAGNMIKTKNYYHGPNAKKFISNKYYYRPTNKCYKYDIVLI